MIINKTTVKLDISFVNINCVFLNKPSEDYMITNITGSTFLMLNFLSKKNLRLIYQQNLHVKINYKLQEKNSNYKKILPNTNLLVKSNTKT